MPDANDTRQVATEDLEASWVRSERKRTLARRCVSLIVIGIVVVHIALLWATMTDFRYSRVPEFAAALSAEGAAISPRLVADVRDRINRLHPHYVAAFERMFARDWPALRDAALQEMQKLDQHAQQKWPQIEQGVNNLVLTSEEIATEELGRFASPEDIRRVQVAYGKALQEKYDGILASTLRGHVDVATEIGHNIERLVETEPDIQPPVDMQEALGILLELAGIELQKGF